MNVRDWRWALCAYFCGKVLRRKKYRPKDVGDDVCIFQRLPKMTDRRIFLLSRLWGHQPIMIIKSVERILPTPQMELRRHYPFTNR